MKINNIENKHLIEIIELLHTEDNNLCSLHISELFYEIKTHSLDYCVLSSLSSDEDYAIQKIYFSKCYKHLLKYFTELETELDYFYLTHLYRTDSENYFDSDSNTLINSAITAQHDTANLIDNMIDNDKKIITEIEENKRLIDIYQKQIDKRQRFLAEEFDIELTHSDDFLDNFIIYEIHKKSKYTKRYQNLIESIVESIEDNETLILDLSE